MNLEIKKMQDEFEAEFQSLKIPHEPKTLYDPIRYVLNLGGKRVRPLLVILGGKMASHVNPAVVKAAIGVELLHNFTLVHDDIMDRSEIRRGRETVHKKFGESVAILVGDTLQVLAMALMNEASMQCGTDLNSLFMKAAVQICEGQQLDMDFENRAEVSLDEYVQMISGKTAVLLGASLQIGALAAGMNAEKSKGLFEFGLFSGICFQLMDDLLDTFGDPEIFGKKTGNDILCNKKTALLITALERADRSDREALLAWLNIFDRPDEKIHHVRQIMERCGAKEETLILIQRNHELAISRLNSYDDQNGAKTQLLEFTKGLLYRQV